MIVERIDDIPLLIAKIQKVEIGKVVDEELELNGNRKGLSAGKLLEIWLSYILSEGDHRLCKLEEWVEKRMYLFKAIYENEELRKTDFTDDRLEKLLDYINESGIWTRIESRINDKFLRVYRLIKDKDGLIPVRLDATIGKGYRKIEEGSLYQLGASKHYNPKLPQFKTMMATLDTEINGFAFPLASVTVPGNTADDVLYLPVIEHCKASLGEADNLLMVGDKKLGSKQNRAGIVESGANYLCPLSKKQVSKGEIIGLVKANEDAIKKIEIEDQQLGQGFEQTKELEVTIEKEGKSQVVSWTERRLVFRSDNYADAQIKALERKVERGVEKLEKLLVKKQGKKALKTKGEIEEAVNEILREGKIEDYITVAIVEKRKVRNVRGYGGSSAKRTVEKIFSLDIKTEAGKVEEHGAYCGWCVYASNVPEEQMAFHEVVQMYRNQFQIESRFNDLKNKVTKLMPVYLQKEGRVRSLINLMMLGLKVICGIELTAAKSLKKAKKKLKGIYSGNPARGTERPSAKMILTRFKGISISIFMEQGKPKSVGLTPLDKVQKNILKLLGLKSNIYEQLIVRMQSYYSIKI